MRLWTKVRILWHDRKSSRGMGEIYVQRIFKGDKTTMTIIQTTITEARKMGITGRLFATRKDIDEGMRIERVKEERERFFLASVLRGVLKQKGLTDEKSI